MQAGAGIPSKLPKAGHISSMLQCPVRRNEAFKVMSKSSGVCLSGPHILRTEGLCVQSWLRAMTLVRFCACFTDHFTELHSTTSLLGGKKDLEKKRRGGTDYFMWQEIFQFFFFFSDIFTTTVRSSRNQIKRNT